MYQDQNQVPSQESQHIKIYPLDSKMRPSSQKPMAGEENMKPTPHFLASKNCDLVTGAQVQELMTKSGMMSPEQIQSCQDQSPHQMRGRLDEPDQDEHANQFAKHIQRVNQFTSPELLMRLHTSSSQLVQETPNCFQVSGDQYLQAKDIKSSQFNSNKPQVMEHNVLQFPQSSYWSKSKCKTKDDYIGFTFGKKGRNSQEEQE